MMVDSKKYSRDHAFLVQSPRRLARHVYQYLPHVYSMGIDINVSPLIMSGAPSSKRQRTNTIGASVSGPDDINLHANVSLLIRELPAETITSFLATAASRDPSIAKLILDEHNRIIAAERAKILDFDQYSKLAWKVINVTYSKLSGSAQYEASFQATADVENYIEVINKATPEHASFGTKKSALETLRKIGKTIALSSDVVGHEVRIQFQGETCLEKTMLRIARGMTAEERAKVLTEEFDAKLEELEQLAEGHCILEKMSYVRRVLSGEDVSSDEGEEEDLVGGGETGDEEESEQTDDEEGSEDTE
jgi:hypothetical protein